MNKFDNITKRVNNPLTWFMALLVAALLAGCGGGGGGGGTTAAVSTTGTSTGTVSAFGSVYVNGVKYDTTGIPIRVNGVASTQTALSVGDVVTVTGSSNGITGVATSIEYWADVEGPISAVNAAGNTLTVFGQAVIVNNTTVFDGEGVTTTTGLTGLTPLLVNNMIEVSGFRDANGAIVASRIEKKTANFVAGAAVEVKGTVSNHTATTFMIGALTVNYVSAPAGLANGVTVEVKGTAQLAAGPLAASIIEIEDSVAAPDGNRGEIEGYITNFVSASNFKLSGQTVNAANATFEHGTAANLADGVKVEVEGTMSGGVLVASEVEFEESTTIAINIEIEALVEAITATSITLLGQTFTYDVQTQMEDETSALSLNSGNIVTRITTSSYVSVRGYKDSSGNLIATRIEVKALPAPLNKVEVQGALEAGAATSELKILGLRITTSTATTFKKTDGTSFDNATAFFAAVTTGMIVKVEGTKTGSGSAAVIAATEIEERGSASH